MPEFDYDSLPLEEQMRLVVVEGIDRLQNGIADDMEDCIGQLADEGISAGFQESDVRWHMERAWKAVKDK